MSQRLLGIRERFHKKLTTRLPHAAQRTVRTTLVRKGQFRSQPHRPVLLKAQLRERYPKARVARNAARYAVADEEFKLISRLEHAHGEKNKAPRDAGLCKHTLS